MDKKVEQRVSKWISINMSLLSLPSDILILIIGHLSLPDLLKLSQLCRQLHGLVSNSP
jgi:F-box domain